MKLIVGLGNFGEIYKNTKHNIGFDVIDFLCHQYNLKLDQNKFNGLYCETKINNEKVIFAKPLTYMNLSGEFVLKIVNFYKINIDDILIIYDDLDLKIGCIKIKKNGSSGGHNGIKNIINLLNTQEIKRIKIGIGRPTDSRIRIDQYVLSKFSFEQKQEIVSKFKKIQDIIELFIGNKFLLAISKYNE